MPEKGLIIQVQVQVFISILYIFINKMHKTGWCKTCAQHLGGWAYMYILHISANSHKYMQNCTNITNKCRSDRRMDIHMNGQTDEHTTVLKTALIVLSEEANTEYICQCDRRR